MCIAIVKPKDKVLSEETLRTCNQANPDGCGFAYIENNTVIIKKFLDFEKFLVEYKKVEGTSNMLIHFRITTHGGTNIDNTHPFILNSRMALIHNGVISGYGDKGEGVSDTRDFIAKVIGNISHKMWKNPSFRELVSDAIGYSKLGILDVSGEFYIINENKGTWDDGVWYSNSSYKPKTYTKPTYTYNYNNNWYKNKTTTTGTQQKLLEDKTTVSVDDNKSSDKDDIKVVFKCNGCGKRFEDVDYIFGDTCPHCGSRDTEDIGWIEDGKTWLYDDIYAY